MVKKDYTQRGGNVAKIKRVGGEARAVNPDGSLGGLVDLQGKNQQEFSRKKHGDVWDVKLSKLSKQEEKAATQKAVGKKK